MPYPNPTTGLGVPVKMTLTTSSAIRLSLSGVNTQQLTPGLTDAGGNVQAAGVVLTLTSCASASGGTTVYTGTITGGGSNAFVDYAFTVAGFVTNTVNNGSFLCTASSGTTLTLTNTAGIAETHAATATAEGLLAFTFISYQPSVATVSSTGLITGISRGQVIVEASYPWGGNTCGTIVTSGNPMNGTPVVKIVKRTLITVVP